LLKYLFEFRLVTLLEFGNLSSLSSLLLLIEFLVLVIGVLAIHGFKDNLLKSLSQVKDSVFILNKLHEVFYFVSGWVSLYLLTYLTLQIL